ncbi:iron-sulfur cluster assembly protein [Halorubrum sp. Boch-26]|uniref:iron-sulfur cluster assembly protein n=1 Tax=Halorubrum sp. Boch-26 TaxID=2994426 RepID=UPI0024692195|nr:iron-sulfur cluster assembly protein [Halorubrum sp. Boch-26]
MAVTADAVRDALDSVTDPELDEPITDLDYIETLKVSERGDVDLAFALPTAWCSPTFAWMMATDARDAVSALNGVEEVRIELLDHMHADEVTRGVNEGLSFETAFDTADGEVASTRETLDRKARLARQYDAMEALDDSGLNDRQIADLRRGDVTFEEGRATIDLDGLYVELDARPLERYLEKARTVGVVADDGHRLFASRDEEPLSPDDVPQAHRASRLAKTNMGGQGGVCASLHAARNPELAGD